ncbi:MAG: hypothetical protein FJY85_03920 [Deltaproteobacteria bacterium]|nr:hypothetical protein [Deltaproteobacteria bacterium]
MEAWWEGLTALNKGFAIAALFFTVICLWQMVSMLVGIDADSHACGDHGGLDAGHVDASGGHHGIDHAGTSEEQPHHVLGGDVTFTLVSLRSVVAFATLFSWSGTLYLMTGTHPILAVAYSVLWGLAAMFGVAYLLFKLLQLQEEGNVSIWDCLGEEARVYMNVPAEGTGKVRVMVRGVLSFVNARSGTGEPLIEGTRVRVTRIVDSNTVEVVPSDKEQGD